MTPDKNAVHASDDLGDEALDRSTGSSFTHNPYCNRPGPHGYDAYEQEKREEGAPVHRD